VNTLLQETAGVPAARWADFLAILSRNRKLILVVFLSMVATVYLVLQLLTERYEVQASLLVKLGRENADIPATVQNNGFFTTGVRREELNSEIRMLSSRELSEQVVDQIGTEAFRFEPSPPQTFWQSIRYYLKKPVRWAKDRARDFLIALNLKKKLSEREMAILAIEQALRVDAEKESDVIRVRLQSPQPDLGVRVLSTLLERYLDQHIAVRRNVAVKEFFDGQMAQLQQQLKSLEEARLEVRARRNLSAVAEQRSLLLKQLSELDTHLAANESEMAMMRERQALMRSRLDSLAEDVRSSDIATANPSIPAIRERLTELQLERAKLASRYLPGSQVIRKVEEEIADLERRLSELEPTILGSVTSVVNPLKQHFREQIEQIDVQVAGLEARSARQRQQAATLSRILEALNPAEDELEALERERKRAEQSYLTYAGRREEARISEELDLRRVANVSVLSPPARPIEPVYPRKLLLIGLTLPLGLLLGIALALALEYMKDAVESERDLESIEGVRYLGTFRITGPPQDGGKSEGDRSPTLLSLGR